MTDFATEPVRTLPWRDINEIEWQAVLATTAALARAGSETELLADVCQAAVESGGSMLAQYKRLDQAHARLRTIAMYGDAQHRTGFTTSGGHRGPEPSPSEIAFHTGTLVYLADVQHDPDFPGWRELAILDGVETLIAMPVLVDGTIDGVLTVYGTDQFVFDDVAKSILATLSQEVGVGLERLRFATRMNRALEGTIRALTYAVESRDPYTAGHQESVSLIAAAIATRLEQSQFEVQGIRLAALIHDIGKLGIPTELLLKPANLREAEMSLIRAHVTIGEEMLAHIEFPWPIVAILGQHHERLDGSGYPRGLRGEEISLAGRILAVADVMDAMSRSRPYRPGIGVEETLQYLNTNRGTLFDAQVVEACTNLAIEGALDR